MVTVTIFHPFSPSAVGLTEDVIPHSHSRPHVLAMRKLAEDDEYSVSMEYITDRHFSYTIKEGNISWKFWPISKRWSGDHKKWKKQWSWRAYLRFALATPDVVIINMSGHGSPFSFALGKMILGRRKHYIAMLGGLHLTLTPKAITYYRQANHILVHTNQQKMVMEEMPELKGCDIRVFPLGVDCDKYAPLTSEANTGNATLLYVGRIVDWKRVHMAIEALDVLIQNGFKNAVLKIVGPKSSESYYDFLVELIQKKGLGNSVFFEGFVEYEKIVTYYREADLFLLPSDKETFGMVMIESMACGTPVAGINCPGGPMDVITNGFDGIISPVEEYSSSILKAFTTPGMLATLKRNARNTAVGKYSIEETYKTLKGSVENCIKK